MTFIDDIALRNQVSNDHLIVQYLQKKTKAADRGSKARRSLGNLYALYVLAEDHLNDRNSRFTDLLSRMKKMPFGSKLQNHPLDNRLNDEFSRQLGVSSPLLPVRALSSEQKIRVLSPELLQHGGHDTKNVAKLIIDVIDEYIQQITSNQTSILEEIAAIETIEELDEFLESAFAPSSDARLFEIASYALLAEHYRGQRVYFGNSPDNIDPTPLMLFRAGRTNANDGGIDFVLRPLGRIFQVTETLDFKKYFLDFEKVNRYPVSFVIKATGSGEDIKNKIRRDAERSGSYSPETIDVYMELFEEIFTLDDLNKLIQQTPPFSLERIKRDLYLQFQLEYGLLD